MKIFTIIDSISGKAGNLFTAQSLAEAERQFHDALNFSDDKSLFKTHPEDFYLRFICDYDDLAGTVSNNNPTEVTRGRAVLPEVPA